MSSGFGVVAGCVWVFAWVLIVCLLLVTYGRLIVCLSIGWWAFVWCCGRCAFGLFVGVFVSVGVWCFVSVLLCLVLGFCFVLGLVLFWVWFCCLGFWRVWGFLVVVFCLCCFGFVCSILLS